MSAVKNVGSVLQLASSGNREVSSNLIRRPKLVRNRDIELLELKKYLTQRKDDKVLVATVKSNGNVRDCLHIPCLNVTSEDIDRKDFSHGLGKILLEPEGCIFFETKNLSNAGVKRLASILNMFVDLWDNRLIVLLENHPGFPG